MTSRHKIELALAWQKTRNWTPAAAIPEIETTVERIMAEDRAAFINRATVSNLRDCLRDAIVPKPGYRSKFAEAP